MNWMSFLILRLKMKSFSLLIFFISFSASAIEIQDYTFSLIFGSANLTNQDGEQTHGSGLSMRTELFLEENWGILASGGTYNTASDSFGGEEVDYTYNTIFAQAGGFLYFANYFRVAAGIGMANIEETKKTATEKFNNEYTEIGPFYQVGFKYPYRPLVFGIDYVYQSYKDFTQKGFFFMLGFVY
jgi:hypothetical protein